MENQDQTSPDTSKRKQRVSQKDVARRAGVSQATVSRVFTDDGSVSDQKREQVLAVAEELGYRPDAIARSLVQRDTRIIGLVIVRFTNPFYARMIKDFTRRLQERGYSTLLLNVEDSQEMEERLPTALQYRVDGVIITSAMLSSKMAEEYARTGTPIVLFNRYTHGGHVNAVCCDNTEGGRLAAQTLLEGGHDVWPISPVSRAVPPTETGSRVLRKFWVNMGICCNGANKEIIPMNRAMPPPSACCKTMSDRMRFSAPTI